MLHVTLNTNLKIGERSAMGGRLMARPPFPRLASKIPLGNPFKHKHDVIGAWIVTIKSRQRVPGISTAEYEQEAAGSLKGFAPQGLRDRTTQGGKFP